VNNPNPYPIKIKKIDADVYVNNKKAGKALLLKKIMISSNSHEFIEAEIETKIQGGSFNLLPLLLKSAISGKTEIRLVGDMKASSYLYGKKISFDITESAQF